MGGMVIAAPPSILHPSRAVWIGGEAPSPSARHEGGTCLGNALRLSKRILRCREQRKILLIVPGGALTGMAQWVGRRPAN